MEKNVIFVLCVVLSSTVAPSPKITKQYRTDYVYNSKTDAFYKLHLEGVKSWLAPKLCEVEGAELMIPNSDYDIMQAHAMFKKYPDIGDYAWVGNDGRKHESAEEQPIIDLGPTNIYYDQLGVCQVITRSGDIERMKCYKSGLPFVCKVAAEDAPYDEHCHVFGKNYRYYSSVGSCYMIPRIPFTWSQAYTECQAEGAHLLVINSEAEHEAIVNMMNTEERVQRAKAAHYFFAGFRAAKPVGNSNVVFKTIFNQTLEEAGFNKWSKNEPNNALGREYCGSIFKNDGKLNDFDCTHELGFICEKEISSSS